MIRLRPCRQVTGTLDLKNLFVGANRNCIKVRYKRTADAFEASTQCRQVNASTSRHKPLQFNLFARPTYRSPSVILATKALPEGACRRPRR